MSSNPLALATCSHGSCAHSRDRSKFKHYREDFGVLTTRPMHLDLVFDMTETRVLVDAVGTYVQNEDKDLTVLNLDCNNLEVLQVDFLAPGNFPDLSLDLPTNNWDKHLEAVARSADKYETLPPSAYVVDTKADKLRITLPSAVKQGQQFVVRTKTIARPTSNILEGLYFDYTPANANAPRTIITQCQQYGFQRIVPSIDQMPSKMCYNTTIIADNRYTNFITNGDLAEGFYVLDEAGLPQPKFHPAPSPAPADVDEELAKRRVMLKFHNWKVPMATYLFFLGVGTYVTYQRDVEYPDGVKSQIELLVFPSLVKPIHAVSALGSLHDSIIWNYLSLGPEAGQHDAERKEVYALIAEREQIKAKLGRVVTARGSKVVEYCSAESKVAPAATDAEMGLPAVETDPSKVAALQSRLAEIRARTAQLMKVWTKTGYQYTAQVYREISMENSNYGGMENVGNTTIISSRIVPSDQLSDGEYVYMEGVKIHEFYHNINGSQVTGQSPFEIWLNEAVTVYAQRLREDELFGADYMRLGQVAYAFMPAVGPLAIDESPTSMAIEPEGFNTTHELISAMTYSKAPEFVRMVRLIIGNDAFHRGLDHYHTKFAYSNATTGDWLRSMEIAGGKDLSRMAKGWLTRTGHPVLTYNTSYDAAKKQVTVSFQQTGFEKHEDKDPWVFPVDWALVKNGRNVKKGIFIMDQDKATLTVDNVDEEPDFASIARFWSFFGRVHNATRDLSKVQLQALSDPDIVNRRLAYLQYTDAEKRKCMDALLSRGAEGKVDNYSVGEDYVAMHAKVLFDDSISYSTRGSLVSEEEVTNFPELAHHYWAISDTRIALLQAVYAKHKKQIIDLFHKVDDKAFYTGAHITALPQRALKRHLLALMQAGIMFEPVFPSSVCAAEQQDVEDPDLFAVAQRLFTSDFMSDRVMAIRLGFELVDGTESASEAVLDGTNIVPPLARLRSKPLISAADKKAFMEKVKASLCSHPDSTSTYITLMSTLNSANAAQVIADLVKEPFFKPELAGHARGVARGWATQRKRSLYSRSGLDLTADLCVEIGKVNEMSAASFIQMFGDIHKVDASVRTHWVKALESIHARLDKEKQTSLYNNIKRILDAVAANEAAK